MIEVIKNENDWKQFISEADEFDVYHTYDYHIINALENEEPILITYKIKEAAIGIPLLKRKIANTDYYDATSVYGYPGIISKGITLDFDIEKFSEALFSYLKESKIISVFSRLNPYIDNSNILTRLGKIEELGDVVYIDLSLDEDEQKAGYSKSIRKQVNKLYKTCSVIEAKESEEFETFIDLYYKNMDRVNAGEYYYFEKKYFENFFKSKDFQTSIYLATLTETSEVIAGSMVIKSKNIIHHHLSATKNDFFKLSPKKMLIDFIRKKGSDSGTKIFNLGGGVGGNKDSVFEFKSSFSKSLKPFKVWKLIVDEDVYKNLVREKQIDSDTGFFPLYRALDVK